VLASKAWERFKSKDTPFGEKAAAYLVTTAMNAKVKMGSGRRRKVNKRARKPLGKGLTFASIVKRARDAIRKKPNPKSVRHAAIRALKAARSFRKGKVVRKMNERTLPLPKTGGILPLVPIFSALSALGSLAGGVTGVARPLQRPKMLDEDWRKRNDTTKPWRLLL